MKKVNTSKNPSTRACVSIATSCQRNWEVDLAETTTKRRNVNERKGTAHIHIQTYYFVHICVLVSFSEFCASPAMFNPFCGGEAVMRCILEKS